VPPKIDAAHAGQSNAPTICIRGESYDPAFTDTGMCTWFMLVRRTSKNPLSSRTRSHPSASASMSDRSRAALVCRICIRVPCIHVLGREAIRMGPRWSLVRQLAIQGAHLLDFPLSLDLGRCTRGVGADLAECHARVIAVSGPRTNDTLEQALTRPDA
jgi:hypothetical protein